MKKKHFKLIGSEDEEKAWAAVHALTHATKWVHIETVGDFLRMRQLDASAVNFDPSDPSTRYALPQRITKWRTGWEDAIISRALSDAIDHGTVVHRRLDDGNYFKSVAVQDHGAWSYSTKSTPLPPGGFTVPSPNFKDLE
jgi:hypothetical protein